MIPGRVLYQDDRDSELTKEGLNNVLIRTEILDIHPDDAKAFNVSQGDEVELSSVRGWSKRFAVNINSSTTLGTVSGTTLFGEMATQLQASKDPMKMLKASRLNISPVRMDPATVVAK